MRPPKDRRNTLCRREAHLKPSAGRRAGGGSQLPPTAADYNCGKAFSISSYSFAARWLHIISMVLWFRPAHAQPWQRMEVFD